MQSATRCHSLPYKTRFNSSSLFSLLQSGYDLKSCRKTINHHESTDRLYFKCIEMCPNPQNLLFRSSHGWNPNKNRLPVVAFLIRNESQASTDGETLALPEPPPPCPCINSHGNMSELFYLSVAGSQASTALSDASQLSVHNWNYSKQTGEISTFPFQLWKMGCLFFFSLGCLCEQKA